MNINVNGLKTEFWSSLSPVERWTMRVATILPIVMVAQVVVLVAKL